jgi:hypothetical protein
MIYPRLVLTTMMLSASALAARISPRADPNPNQGQPVSVGVSTTSIMVFIYGLTWLNFDCVARCQPHPRRSSGLRHHLR